MKKTITLLLALCIANSLFAQKTSVIIKVLKTVQDSYGRNSESSADVKIEDFVTNAFVNTKKFDIVDRGTLKDIQDEKQLQKSEDFIDGKVIEQSKMLGADYLVGISITTLNLTGHTYQGTTSGYGCKITFSIKIVDIASSQIVATETFTNSAGQGLMSFVSSADAAMDKCLAGIEPKLDEFIKGNFPISASIANIENTDATGSATSILISAGSGNGVAIGDVFKIVEFTSIDVDGKQMTRKKEIGLVQVTSIEDENFSVCTVNTGGMDIANKKKEGKKIRAILNQSTNTQHTK